ncbi:GNAT family N-acetyltransferase [Archangium lansingense]|uniref:GNAT family N-acetyltransferase n=1 Tax=Archangium lansingense TaxID=2995310 RepID=A0ABT4ACB3_9BACT|nr:GNAT family N-acetyltransferase [Archangium lansinium]MCY1079320.1 GNAT family N-acetyltransferase [Archangium lansinium]
MTNPIERLQSYMRRSAAGRYESIPVPPFTVFLHPFDALIYFNYAIPDGAITGDVSEPLKRLRAEFQKKGRVPRFEYVAELAPALADTLLAAGFRQEAEARVMICTRESFTPAPMPEGLSFSVLTSGSSREELRTYCNTSRRGFSPDEPYEASEEEISKTLEELREGRAVVGYVEGQPAVVGTFTSPSEGISELVGVATLTSFRKRGLGSALTSRVAQEAFARGVDVLFLSTITEEAGRIYERVGFRFATRMLFMVEGSHPEGAMLPIPG